MPSFSKVLKKALILIIASPLFFPVSCTLSNLAGTFGLSYFDARDAEKGETPHPPFFVLQVEAGKHISAVRVDNGIENINQNQHNVSFLLPADSGTFQQAPGVDELDDFSFKVTKLSPSKQLVEVAFSGYKHSSISRYSVEGNKIAFIYSRVLKPLYTVISFPGAIAIALALYIIGKRLKKKVFPEIK